MKKVDYNIEYAHLYADDERVSIGKEQEKSIELTEEVIEKLERKGKTYSLNLLIDNYNGNVDRVDEDHLYSQLEEKGIAPDYIVYEADLVRAADSLIDKIRDSYIKRGENEISFTSSSDDFKLWEAEQDLSFKERFFENQIESKDNIRDKRLNHTVARRDSNLTTAEIVLKYVSNEADEVRYTCPLLTACWHLARLGVDPFQEAVDDIKSYSSKPFFGKYLFTVLSSQYLKIEGTAMELISLASSKRIKENKERFKYRFF